MGTIVTEVAINISDVRAALVALLDGNEIVAIQILSEVIEEYEETLEEDH